MRITPTFAALLCFILRPFSVSGTGNSSIGDLLNNYWGGTLIDPNNGDGTTGNGHWKSGDAVTTYSNDVSYPTTSPAALGSRTSVPSSITCSGSLPSITEQSVSLSSKTQNPDSCAALAEWMFHNPQTEEEYCAQYDTLRRYIESCANTPNSFHAFTDIGAAWQRCHPHDTSRDEQYRNWLLSVLYLNTTDPFYYCACAGELASTFTYGPNNFPNASLEVFKYLADSSGCTTFGFEDLYTSGIASRHNAWLRGDTTVPEDTTMPTLDQLGLGALRLHLSGVPVTGQLPAAYLVSFIGAPNPFTKETELTFTLNRMTYVTVAIYDELGRMVWGDGKGHSLDAGTHTIRIDGTGLPSGTLYARISTGFGEVKTVKLVHQE